MELGRTGRGPQRGRQTQQGEIKTTVAISFFVTDFSKSISTP